MGKAVPSARRFKQFAKDITSSNQRSRRLAQLSLGSETGPILYTANTETRSDFQRPVPAKTRQMAAASESSEPPRRMPLAEVVADCVSRWFQYTLKEAKAGDVSMQVLVGQMYYSGYGVPRDAEKGRTWIGRVAERRSSVWKVGNKHPGYNASDSDSDDTKEDVE